MNWITIKNNIDHYKKNQMTIKKNQITVTIKNNIDHCKKIWMTIKNNVDHYQKDMDDYQK